MAQFIWNKLNADKCPLDIRDLPPGTIVVGGAIRDVLLDRHSTRLDLDLVVPNEAIKLTRRLAKDLGGTCVVLDFERDIARLVLRGWSIDFARQIGESIETDLWRRDFTINAIALTTDQLNPRIIDPTGGLLDIRRKTLCAVKELNLIEDPLRLLRGFRLMAEHQLSVDSETRNLIERHSHLLERSAPERIKSELLRLAVAPWADEVLPAIKKIGLLNPWKNIGDNFEEKVPSLVDAKFFKPSELGIALPLVRLTNLLSDKGLLKLRFSKKQCQRCKVLRKWQKRNDDNASKGFSEVDLLQLHIDLEADLPAFILGLPLRDQAHWLGCWRDITNPLFHPSSPLDGNILQAKFGISSGIKLGKLIHHLTHENAFGRLRNREEAFESAKNWLQQNPTLL